jgi:hypothetical protein
MFMRRAAMAQKVCLPGADASSTPPAIGEGSTHVLCRDDGTANPLCVTPRTARWTRAMPTTKRVPSAARSTNLTTEPP